MDVKQTERELERESELLSSIRREIERVIIGQTCLIERLRVGLLCNNHVLIEGVPGSAKTMSVTTLAGAIRARFSRIQFTPDLLPAKWHRSRYRPHERGLRRVDRSILFAAGA